MRAGHAVPRACRQAAVLRTLHRCSAVDKRPRQEPPRVFLEFMRLSSSVTTDIWPCPMRAGVRDGARRKPGRRGLRAHGQQRGVAAGRGAQEAAGRQPQRRDAQGDFSLSWALRFRIHSAAQLFLMTQRGRIR